MDWLDWFDSLGSNELVALGHFEPAVGRTPQIVVCRRRRQLMMVDDAGRCRSSGGRCNGRRRRRRGHGKQIGGGRRRCVGRVGRLRYGRGRVRRVGVVQMIGRRRRRQ